MSDPEVKIQEIPNVVKACPLCSAPFEEALSANKKITCPEDLGGCGGTFLVKKYTN